MILNFNEKHSSHKFYNNMSNEKSTYNNRSNDTTNDLSTEHKNNIVTSFIQDTETMNYTNTDSSNNDNNKKNSNNNNHYSDQEDPGA